MQFKKILICSSFVLAITAGQTAISPAYAHVDISFDVNTPPPEPIVEAVPAPRPGYTWAPGYWEWEGHRHVWQAGHWVVDRPGYHYVSERWEQRGPTWHMVPGHWEGEDRKWN